MIKLPLETEIERAIMEAGLERDRAKWQAEQAEIKLAKVTEELRAERKLRAEIAQDLQEISAAFDNILTK